MKKKQTNHNITKKARKPKADTIYGEFKNLMQWRQIKPTKDFLGAIVDRLEEWVNDEEQTDIYAFIHYMGIPSKTYYRWAKKYEELEFAHTQAMEILGVRKARHAEYKKYGANDNMVKHTIRFYHPIYRKAYDEDKERDDNKSKDPIILRVEKI